MAQPKTTTPQPVRRRDIRAAARAIKAEIRARWRRASRELWGTTVPPNTEARAELEHVLAEEAKLRPLPTVPTLTHAVQRPGAGRHALRASAARARSLAAAPTVQLRKLLLRVQAGAAPRRLYLAALRDHRRRVQAARATSSPLATPAPRTDFKALVAAMRCPEWAPTPSLRKLLGAVRRGEMPRAKYTAALERYENRIAAAEADKAAA